MFVPSLSWQTLGFSVQNSAKHQKTVLLPAEILTSEYPHATQAQLTRQVYLELGALRIVIPRLASRLGCGGTAMGSKLRVWAGCRRRAVEVRRAKLIRPADRNVTSPFQTFPIYIMFVQSLSW